METVIEQQGIYENFSSREIDVIQSRYGLNGHKKETLEYIGSRYGITRERIRQIQENYIKKLRYKKGLPLSGDQLPNIFAKNNVNSGFYLLMAHVYEIKFMNVDINNQRFFVNANYKDQVIDLINTIRKLPKDLGYEEKTKKIMILVKKNDILKDLQDALIEETKNKRNKTDRIVDILKSAKYPMHFMEIYQELPAEDNMNRPRNVLAKLQRRTDLFVRVANGTYTLKDDENSKSVQFIKDIIIEYLGKYQKGSPNEIYNYVVSRRQCSPNSITIMLSVSPEFKEVERGIFSLREESVVNGEERNLDNILNSLLKEKGGRVFLNDFIGRMQKELPEISVIEVYEYLNNNSSIYIDNNFIMKKK